MFKHFIILQPRKKAKGQAKDDQTTQRQRSRTRGHEALPLDLLGCSELGQIGTMSFGNHHWRTVDGQHSLPLTTTSAPSFRGTLWDCRLSLCCFRRSFFCSHLRQECSEASEVLSLWSFHCSVCCIHHWHQAAGVGPDRIVQCQ